MPRKRRRIQLVTTIAVVAALFAYAVPPATALLHCSVATDPICPVATEDFYTTTFGKTLTVLAPAGLLANDYGPNGAFVDPDSSDTSSFNGNATVRVHTDGSFVYIPDPDTPFSGTDSFDYTITDADGDTDFNTAYVEVEATTKDDVYYTNVDAPLDVTAPAALDNDLGVDPSTVVYDAFTDQGGVVSDDGDGAFVYTPPEGFSGADTFDYIVSDFNFEFDYTATVTVHVDSTAPVVTMSSPASVNLAATIVPKWSGSDSSGVAGYDVQKNVAPWNTAYQGWTSYKSSITATSLSVAGTPGRGYCFRVRGRDPAGNVSNWSASRCTVVPLRSTSLTYSAGWTARSSTSYYGGSARRTTTKGAKVTRATVRATSISLVATKCATCGVVQVRWNGKVTATVNLTSTTTRYRQVIRVVTLNAVAVGTLTATVTSPTGKQVIVEGLAVSPT